MNGKPTSSAESPISSIEFSSFFHLQREGRSQLVSVCKEQCLLLLLHKPVTAVSVLHK